MRKIANAQSVTPVAHGPRQSPQHKIVYFRVQTQSKAQWGMLDKLSRQLRNMQLEIVDHRTWHPTDASSDVMVANEVHCRDTLVIPRGASIEATVQSRQEAIDTALRSFLRGTDAQVRIDQWDPSHAVGAERAERNYRNTGGRPSRRRVQSTPVGRTLFDGNLDSHHQAVLLLDGNESFHVQISPASLQALRAGRTGQIKVEPSVGDRLEGFVRNQNR